MIARLRGCLVHPKYHALLIPCLAVILGFAVGAVVMAVSGLHPKYILIALVRSMFGVNVQAFGTGRSVWNFRYMGEGVVTCLPLILTGLAVAFTSHMGLFNIGAEGQLVVGSVCAVCVGVLWHEHLSFFTIPAAVLAGMVGGGLLGLIPGVLRAVCGISEVVVTIMLNYVGLYGANFVVTALPGSDLMRTVSLPPAATLHSDFLSRVSNGSRLHWGFLLVIAALVSFKFLIEKTTFGYELRVVGASAEAARYAGIHIRRRVMLATSISGMYAGLAGVLLAIGTFSYGRVLPGFEGYGFEGIVVSLVGRNTAWGCVFGGSLLGSLRAAGPLMQLNGVPKEVSVIIVSAIIVFLSMHNGIRAMLVRWGRQGAHV